MNTGIKGLKTAHWVFQTYDVWCIHRNHICRYFSTTRKWADSGPLGWRLSRIILPKSPKKCILRSERRPIKWNRWPPSWQLSIRGAYLFRVKGMQIDSGMGDIGYTVLYMVGVKEITMSRWPEGMFSVAISCSQYAVSYTVVKYALGVGCGTMTSFW